MTSDLEQSGLQGNFKVIGHPLTDERREDRRPWDRLLELYAEYQQDALIARYRIEAGDGPDQIDQGYLQTGRNVTIARLTMERFAEGGYGECLSTDYALDPLRKAIALIREIDDTVQAERKSDSFDRLLTHNLYIAELTAKLADIDLSQIDKVPLISGCSKGWPHLDRAQEQLDRARDYNAFNLTYRTAQPVP